MDQQRAWQRLGETRGTRLGAARGELHWAAQLVAAAGFSFVEPEDDFSHTNMGWLAGKGAFVGQTTQGDGATNVHLAVGSLEISLAGGGRTLPLAGQTLSSAYHWLARALTARGYWNSLVRPDYEMPHARAENQPFAMDPAALAELAAWYENADILLGEVAAEHGGASPVRCWPHHFDIATLIDLGAGKSVGAGMTPGDGSYPEPYWYVTPWPYPENPTTPELPGGGHWHRQGWFGAVLTGPAALAGDAAAQAARARDFLSAAVAASLDLVG